MSLIGRIQHKAATLPLTGGRYEIIGGQLIGLSDNVSGYVRDGYNMNDIIYSVVNLILEKIKMAPWAIYTVKDDSSLKELRAYQSKKIHTGEEKRKMVQLFNKALEVFDKPSKWGDLLKFPNERQSFCDLVVYAIGYKMLTGNGFLWANQLDAGVNKGTPQELWVMPSQDMMIKATRDFPSRVTAYQMNGTNRTVLDFRKEEVMHVIYPNYSAWDISSQLWGMAPLKAACLLTNRNNSALKASTSMFQNKGLQHVLYIDEPNLTQEDRAGAMGMMTELKKKLVSDEYSGPNAAGKVTGANYKLGALNLGLSAVDLQIIEAEKWDMRRFCNIFGGVPSQLLNDPDNKVYNNMKEGEVALTTRGALPQLKDFQSALNRKAHTDWELPPEQIIDFDATVYSELQDDVKDMAAWVIPVAQQTGLSPNRVLDLLGLETIEEDFYNQPRVTQQMGETLSDSQLNIVDQTLNNGES